jgi:hypothetical protein
MGGSGAQSNVGWAARLATGGTRTRRAIGDFWAYGARTGRWWLPLVVLLVAIASLVAKVAVEIVIPTAIYTLI